jgi:hypothetical protein
MTQNATVAATVRVQQAASRTGQALKDAILRMQQTQQEGITKMEATLGALRSKTEAMITASVPVATPANPLAVKQMELEQSGWTQLVTIAAAVDDTFREQAMTLAKETLIRRGVIQAPTPAPEQPAG